MTSLPGAMTQLPRTHTAAPEPSLYTTLVLPSLTLWQREVVRFLRQKNRVIGALASPIVFWFLIGSGMGRSFSPPGSTGQFSYLNYFFPGTLLLIMLFTAIFSTISIIEDRREGFLQAVLAAPVARTAIVLGKLLGGTTLALLQGLLFCALGPLAGVHMQWTMFPALVGVLIVLGLGVTALGYIIAWPLDSTQGFHAIMNLFLIPLWLLSGALFPAQGASGWVQVVMMLNPLHYGLTALQWIFAAPDISAAHAGVLVPGASWELSLLVLAGFAVVLTGICAWMTRRVPGLNP